MNSRMRRWWDGDSVLKTSNTSGAMLHLPGGEFARWLCWSARKVEALDELPGEALVGGAELVEYVEDVLIHNRVIVAYVLRYPSLRTCIGRRRRVCVCLGRRWLDGLRRESRVSSSLFIVSPTCGIVRGGWLWWYGAFVIATFRVKSGRALRSDVAGGLGVGMSLWGVWLGWSARKVEALVGWAEAVE